LELRTNLDEACEIQEQCTANIEHSECGEDSRCKCIDDAIPHPSNQACLKRATGLGDSCQIDDQCVDLENSMCLPDGDGGELKCLCDTQTHVRNPDNYDDNKCYPVSMTHLYLIVKIRSNFSYENLALQNENICSREKIII